MKTKSLKEMLWKHQSVHLMKRWAHLENNGVVPDYFFTDSRHVFVLSMVNTLSTIDSSIEYSEILINQIIHEPPISWLELFDLSFEKFSKHNFNTFCMVLYSVFDQVLLLINETFIEPLDKKKVSYKSIHNKIKHNYELERTLASYFTYTNDIAVSRHSYVHESKGRDAGRLDSIHRLNTVMKAWNIPLNSVSTYIDLAKEELVQKMTDELNISKEFIKNTENLLIPDYLHKLNNLGGLDSPSEKEWVKARKTVKYLSGDY